jgi:hypothetical protein
MDEASTWNWQELANRRAQDPHLYIIIYQARGIDQTTLDSTVTQNSIGTTETANVLKQDSVTFLLRTQANITRHYCSSPGAQKSL